MKTIRLGQEFEPFAGGVLDNKPVGVTSGRFWLEWCGALSFVGKIAHLEGYSDQKAKCLVLDHKREGLLIGANLVPTIMLNQGYLLTAAIEYNPNKPTAEREADLLLCYVTIGSLGLHAKSSTGSAIAYFYDWCTPREHGYGSKNPATEIIAVNEAVFRNMRARFVKDNV